MNPIDSFLYRRAFRQWGRAARRADKMELHVLRSLRKRARALQRQLGKVLHVADARLAAPNAVGNEIPRPLHCDWAYRPEVWRGPLHPPGLAAVESKTPFGQELNVFHDCSVSELTLRQIRNTRSDDQAAFGLQMEVFRFDGSFLSLVVELPDDAANGLQRRHIIRLVLRAEVERPLEVFARLNIKNGPNVEQIVQELRAGEDEDLMVEFDLAYTKINEKRVERMWLDLIFEGAELNRILLRDVTLTRRPRAEI